MSDEATDFWRLQPFGGGSVIALKPSSTDIEEVATRLNLNRWALQHGFTERQGSTLAHIFSGLYLSAVNKDAPPPASVKLDAAFDRAVRALTALQGVANSFALQGDSRAVALARWTGMLLGEQSVNQTHGIRRRLQVARSAAELQGAFRESSATYQKKGAPLSQARICAESMLSAWWLVFKALPTRTQSRIFLNLVSGLLPTPIGDETSVRRAIRNARKGWRGKPRHDVWDEQ